MADLKIRINIHGTRPGVVIRLSVYVLHGLKVIDMKKAYLVLYYSTAMHIANRYLSQSQFYIIIENSRLSATSNAAVFYSSAVICNANDYSVVEKSPAQL